MAPTSIIRKIVAIVLAATAIVLILILIGAVVIKPISWRNSHGGGWSVALVTLDSSESVLDVYDKVESGKLQWVDGTLVAESDTLDFLADPFLFRHNDSIFLFVETAVMGRGAYITAFYLSDSSFVPHYQGVALKEPFHLSYPQVVKQGTDILMIPESSRGDSSFFYACRSMPLLWERIGAIYPAGIKDPTLWSVSDSTGYFYYSDKGKLYKHGYVYRDGSFELSHRAYVKTGTTFRPGGNPLLINGHPHILLQDNSQGYGTALFGFPLDEFGDIARDQESCHLLKPSQSKEEFSAGMHHMSILELGNGRKLVAVDGNRLVSDAKKLSIKSAVKKSYLKWWDFVFGSSAEPFYPFNE